MPKQYDQNGNECQMTGLPHIFYDKVAVDEEMKGRDARIDELERALKSCAHVLSQMLRNHNLVTALASEAILEADRALKVNG